MGTPSPFFQKVSSPAPEAIATVLALGSLSRKSHHSALEIKLLEANSSCASFCAIVLYFATLYSDDAILNPKFPGVACASWA